MPSLMNKKIAEESKDNICFRELSLQLNTIILIILKDILMEVIKVFQLFAPYLQKVLFSAK